MIQYNPKHQVKVEGKMTAEDAGLVGRRLAAGAFFFAVCAGLALLMWGASLLVATWQ